MWGSLVDVRPLNGDGGRVRKGTGDVATRRQQADRRHLKQMPMSFFGICFPKVIFTTSISTLQTIARNAERLSQKACDILGSNLVLKL
jgi:hypothetical protein